jgi:hypothetical protein
MTLDVFLSHPGELDSEVAVTCMCVTFNIANTVSGGIVTTTRLFTRTRRLLNGEA